MKYNEFERCGVKVLVSMISGKWKPLILFHLFKKEERFTGLWRIMPKVSKKVLLEQLKQMEADGLIIRSNEKGFPPEVHYSLSEKGRSLGPILDMMNNWVEVQDPVIV